MHWQNLKEDGDKHWLCGRVWLGDWRAEWTVWRSSIRLGLDLDAGENECTFSIGLWLFCLYISKRFKHIRIKKERSFHLYWYECAIWLKLWGDDNWNSKDRWWRRGIAIHLDDIFLGRQRYSEEPRDIVNTFIPMPEGCYPAIIRLYKAIWSRPMWFPKKLMRATIDVPGGIPHEGKGENSWDCGEDGLLGLTCQAETVEEAIGKTVASVLYSRRRNGGGFTHRQLGQINASGRGVAK